MTGLNNLGFSRDAGRAIGTRFPLFSNLEVFNNSSQQGNSAQTIPKHLDYP